MPYPNYEENVTVLALLTLRQLRKQRRVAIRKYAANMRGGYATSAASHAQAALHLTREIDKREGGTL